MTWSSWCCPSASGSNGGRSSCVPAKVVPKGALLSHGDARLTPHGGLQIVHHRICGLSAPGEILVSATIRDLARTSAGATFEDRGEHALKGIEEPVRVWAVR